VNAVANQAIALLVMLSLVIPPPARAQTNTQTSIPAPTAGASNASQAVFRVEELDQMVAPIALYPDELLAQVLVAATYPLEVVQAERWVKESGNAKLKGDQLASALEPQSWDPSVKSLVPFPQVLTMMSEKLDWTQRLGDAFLAQQGDVMESVQRLRRQAQDAGNLKTTEQQTVVTHEKTVVIEPANPEVVYVPSYNPSEAYGAWPYPSYPPVSYPPPPAYYPGYPPGYAFGAGLAFATGVAVVGSLWGWGNCNWGGNNVSINANRYNTINASNIRAGRATQLPANTTNWRHNPAHRGGVPYRDAASRQNFQRPGARPTPVSSDFRGRDTGQRGAGQGANRASARTSAPAQRQAGTRSAAPPRQQANRPSSVRQGGGANRPQAAQRQRQAPSAFQGMGNGSQTRAQADRGRASRQSVSAPSRPNASAARAPARGGGGMRAGGGGGRRR
jgi:hypothetical protein